MLQVCKLYVLTFTNGLLRKRKVKYASDAEQGRKQKPKLRIAHSASLLRNRMSKWRSFTYPQTSFSLLPLFAYVKLKFPHKVIVKANSRQDDNFKFLFQSKFDSSIVFFFYLKFSISYFFYSKSPQIKSNKLLHTFSQMLLPMAQSYQLESWSSFLQ